MKIFALLGLLLVSVPVFSSESFEAKCFSIGKRYGTNRTPDEFYTIQKGKTIFYIGTTLEFLQFKVRLVKENGTECWFDLYDNDHNYEHYGFPNPKPGPLGDYYAEPVYTGTKILTFQNEDVFLYKVVERFVDELERFEFDVNPEYFRSYVLPHVETRYLRYLRNAIFALYDYKFSSKDLMDFFSQFNWYAYDESMTIDKINEKMPQKFVNLVTYIKEEEDRRK